MKNVTLSAAKGDIGFAKLALSSTLGQDLPDKVRSEVEDAQDYLEDAWNTLDSLETALYDLLR